MADILPKNGKGEYKMKKLLSCILALTCVVGVYFAAPKSAGILGGTKVYAAAKKDKEWYIYKVNKAVTLYYYNSSGTKQSVKLKKGELARLRWNKYYVVYGSKGEQYQINVESYKKDGTLLCME